MNKNQNQNKNRPTNEDSKRFGDTNREQFRSSNKPEQSDIPTKGKDGKTRSSDDRSGSYRS